MFGIITIAQGDERYLEMAKKLALSLKKSNPELKRAVITDASNDTFAGYFDIIIPYNSTFGNGLAQKLYLEKYSPFEETLFIDSDCLVIRPLDNLLSTWSQYSFVVLGDQISTGEWYMNVEEMCKKFKLTSIPLFNGGVYYFKKCDLTSNIYNCAREMMNKYDDMGFIRFRGGVNEEPLISIAMARNNVYAINDEGTGMRTPIGIKGTLQIDILNDECRFFKENCWVEPAIMHFCGEYAKAFHYRRETFKLFLAVSHKMNRNLVYLITLLSFNLPYATLVFFKRIIKTVLRREKYNFNNILPVFSNL